MVYFVADNIVSPLGFNSNENYEALFMGKTGISKAFNKEIYHEPFPAALIDSEKRKKH